MKVVKPRSVEVAVISDVHLGTYGCHAKELLKYLKSIKPKTLILNGDIIDIWQFNKRYWPKSHMKVIKHLTGLISKGVRVIYITGNHDEMLRKFDGFSMGSFEIVNKAILDLPTGKAWFFHGDVFDVTMQHSKWLARLGAIGYDTLIILNRLVNWCLLNLGRGRMSFSKKVKESVKGAIKFINNFEQTAADIAISKEYKFVVCGHIHQPEKKKIGNSHGEVMYLNSGDWIENLTALEYNDNKWSLYYYFRDTAIHNTLEDDEPSPKSKELFTQLVQEFNLVGA